MSKRKHETGENEKPENHFFPHSTVEGDDERIVDAAHFAKAWFDHRTIPIGKEEEIQYQTKDESREHAEIQKVAQLEAPVFRHEKQRALEIDRKSTRLNSSHL